MSTAELRKELKKAIDKLPRQRLQSLADYVYFLNRPSLQERIERGRRDIAAGKAVDWRKVRRDCIALF